MICGAKLQDGKVCQVKVKTKGPCWRHPPSLSDTMKPKSMTKVAKTTKTKKDLTKETTKAIKASKTTTKAIKAPKVAKTTTKPKKEIAKATKNPKVYVVIRINNYEPGVGNVGVYASKKDAMKKYRQIWEKTPKGRSPEFDEDDERIEIQEWEVK